MNLYKGFQNLNEYNYGISKEAFRESFNLYNRLKDTTGIEEDTKKIFKTYWKISKFFNEFIPTIEKLREENINKLNTLIKERLQEFTKNLPKSSSCVQRIKSNIKNIQFDSKFKTINQFKCEIPTKFCPKPPVITYKRLLDDEENIIFEWDKDNKPSITEPIEVSCGWRKYYLEIEFAEKHKYFDFKLDCEKKSYFKIEDIERKSLQSGKASFEFYLNFEDFLGKENL